MSHFLRLPRDVLLVLWVDVLVLCSREDCCLMPNYHRKTGALNNYRSYKADALKSAFRLSKTCRGMRNFFLHEHIGFRIFSRLNQSICSYTLLPHPVPNEKNCILCSALKQDLIDKHRTNRSCKYCGTQLCKSITTQHYAKCTGVLSPCYRNSCNWVGPRALVRLHRHSDVCHIVFVRGRIIERQCCPGNSAVKDAMADITRRSLEALPIAQRRRTPCTPCNPEPFAVIVARRVGSCVALFAQFSKCLIIDRRDPEWLPFYNFIVCEAINSISDEAGVIEIENGVVHVLPDNGPDSLIGLVCVGGYQLSTGGTIKRSSILNETPLWQVV